jgi:hypothetical protein
MNNRTVGGRSSETQWHERQQALRPMDIRVLSLAVKWPMHVANHSHPSSTEVKKAWSLTSNPHTSAGITWPVSVYVKN